MRIIAVLVGAALVAVLPASSQEKRDSTGRAVYKVEFNIRDGNPAVAKAGRRYSMLVESDGRGVFRLGDKVPYVTGAVQSNPGTALNTQYNYADVGVTIDCRVREANTKVSLSANLELSSVVHLDRATPGVGPHPTIASTRVEVTTELEPGKPTLISTVDDPVTQRKLDIEVLASRVN